MNSGNETIMFSVIRTAIANNLDPYWYLRYLLDNLLNLKTKEDFSAFMPQNVTKEQLISYKEQILAYENSLLQEFKNIIIKSY